MKNKRIEELEAQVEHLQECVDNLRDYVTEYKDFKDADYHWNKFEDLLAWSLKFDKNSDEYSKLSRAGWEMLDIYLDCLLLHGVYNEKSKRKD